MTWSDLDNEYDGRFRTGFSVVRASHVQKGSYSAAYRPLSCLVDLWPPATPPVSAVAVPRATTATAPVTGPLYTK
eukprot:6190571-Pleurochrysis_carterae.AAC.2